MYWIRIPQLPSVPRVATALAGAALAGCTAGESDAPRRGRGPGEVIVGVGADEFGLQLNRHRIGVYPLNASICEAPFRLTASLATEPSLATRADYRGGGTYRLTLRRGVVFHDGSLLAATSVGETLERSIRLRTQYSFLSSSSVVVVNDSTIDLTPAIPNMRLVDQLAHPTYGVTARGTDPSKRPVCTGPFRFVEYVPQSHLTVERNEDYWGVRAKLDRLTFRFIPDDNTRGLALRSGELDAIYDVNRGMVASLQRARGIKVVKSAPASVLVMYIAMRAREPFTIMADPAVRRAVAMSINRKLLAERVLGGHASVVNTVNPPVVLGEHAARVHGIDYDPDGARRVLDSAGWTSGPGRQRRKNGRPLVLTLISQPGAVDRAVMEFVQAQLAQVGIRVKVEHLEPGAFESRLNSGRFDIDIELPNQNDGNPAFLLALRWYSKSNVRSAPLMLAGARFDSLVTASLAAPLRDDAQRLAADAMHELVDRQIGAIPLAGLFRIYALSTRLSGFDPHPSRASQWWNTVSVRH